MTAAGIALSAYAPGALAGVPEEHDLRPDLTFDLARRLGEPGAEWLRDRYGEGGEDRIELASVATRIPMELYRALSLDELCKLRFASRFMMDQSVEDAFHGEPPLTVFHKITNGMWRWGCGRPGWNEVVDAYEGIRRFDLGHPDFEVRLDHSTSCNECGYSEHSRTYLDGVFGYLVHHKGEHVMTLGFSLMEGRRLLIQQVQLRNRRGNRWLFKLPRNYVEHAIGRFREAFPRHRLLIVDGGEVIGRSLSSYREGLARAERLGAEAERRLARATPENAEHHRWSIERHSKEAVQLRECISHAEREVGRIDRLYADTGRFRRGAKTTVNSLAHYDLTDES